MVAQALELATPEEIENDSKLISPLIVANAYLSERCDWIFTTGENNPDYRVTADDLWRLCAIAAHFGGYEKLGSAAGAFDHLLIAVITESRCISDAEFEKLCRNPDAVAPLMADDTLGAWLSRWSSRMTPSQLDVLTRLGMVTIAEAHKHTAIELAESIRHEFNAGEPGVWDKYEALVAQRGGPRFEGDEHSFQDVATALLDTFEVSAEGIRQMHLLMESVPA